MTPTRTTTDNNSSTSTTLSPSSKKTTKETTSRLRSVVTRPTPTTETKEKETPRCQRSHSPPETNTKKIKLPFCDLRHRLINGVGSRRRADRSQEREIRKRAPLVERLGGPRHRSTHRGSFTRPSWTRSITILGQQRLPSAPSGVWARLSSKSGSRRRSGSEPRNSRSSSTGRIKTLINGPSLTRG